MTFSRVVHRRVPVAALLALAVSILLCTVEGAQAQPQPTVFVFLHTDVKSRVLEQTLRASLHGLEVSVFGRFRDFEEALTTRPPDAVVALQPVLAARKLEPTLRGVSGGSDVEDFVLVSAGAPIEGPLADRSVGVLDFLGRKGTHDFVAALLKAPEIRLKFVTKVEDLLSLLQFAAADAILVPADIVKTFRERSRLSLHVRALPEAAVGRAAVAVLSPATSDLIIRQIQALDAKTNRMLGVDVWRPR